MQVITRSLHDPAASGSIPDLSDPAMRERLSPAALDGMVRLAAIWKLSTEECCGLLGDLSERSWFRMKRADGRGERSPALSPDMLTRISVLVGLFKGLRLMFSEELADSWMRLPNNGPLFGGATPLAVAMRRGIPGMLEIRAHVDALRGGL
ncbi:MAG: DUF2384 domain-containing protein [Gluconacetobacter diazotrophicus]|nr:DUF2384 domain-containing protein [Gluconacetobacter diazotrophicus]